MMLAHMSSFRLLTRFFSSMNSGLLVKRKWVKTLTYIEIQSPNLFSQTSKFHLLIKYSTQF